MEEARERIRQNLVARAEKRVEEGQKLNDASYLQRMKEHLEEIKKGKIMVEDIPTIDPVDVIPTTDGIAEAIYKLKEKKAEAEKQRLLQKK